MYNSDSHKGCDDRGLPLSKGNMRSPRDLKMSKLRLPKPTDADVTVDHASSGKESAEQVRISGSGAHQHQAILEELQIRCRA